MPGSNVSGVYRQYGTNYISVMPTKSVRAARQLDLKNSHVLPAFDKEIIEARKEGSPSVTVWGQVRLGESFFCR